MQMVQCELGNGVTRIITWLPRDSRVKAGTVISLDKEDRKWKVLRQFNVYDSGIIQRGWKVGGLL